MAYHVSAIMYTQIGIWAQKVEKNDFSLCKNDLPKGVFGISSDKETKILFIGSVIRVP
jgi:hypothetical protein